jgi:peptidoglycan/xylan/chitin deacetylase (PgdA/CDA1 family)
MRVPHFVGHALGQLQQKAPTVARVRRSVAGDSPSVALTFDDGPDAVFTPQVLDILAELSVPATFFLVGERATKMIPLVRRMIDEGHQIGSHSMTHPDPWKLSLPALAREYRTGQRTLEKISGRPVSLFRPPQGALNLQQAVVIRMLGLFPWLWNRDPKDWVSGITTEGIVTSLVEPAPGDVILLHDAIASPSGPDSRDRSATVAALPQIIERVRNHGLDFVVLPWR